jgi:hypothetical protein
MIAETLLIIIGGLFWLYYKLLKPNGLGLLKPKPKPHTVTITRTRTLIPVQKPTKPEPKPDPNRYPVFPGSNPEESECDDNLDEIDDITGENL